MSNKQLARQKFFTQISLLVRVGARRLALLGDEEADDGRDKDDREGVPAAPAELQPADKGASHDGERLSQQHDSRRNASPG
jgi:hypothetical protein